MAAKCPGVVASRAGSKNVDFEHTACIARKSERYMNFLSDMCCVPFFSAADWLSGDSLCPNLLLTFYIIPHFDVSWDGLHCAGDNLDDDMELTPLALDLENGPGNNNNNENINTNNNILTMDIITEEEGGAMDKTDSKRGSTANSSNNVSRSPSTGDMSPGMSISVACVVSTSSVACFFGLMVVHCINHDVINICTNDGFAVIAVCSNICTISFFNIHSCSFTRSTVPVARKLVRFWLGLPL